VYAVGSGNTATIYAAAYGGVSISSNGGTNWTNYTNGLGSTIVGGVYASVDNGTVYAATDGGVSISQASVSPGTPGGNGGNGGNGGATGLGGKGGAGGSPGGTTGTNGQNGAVIPG